MGSNKGGSNKGGPNKGGSNKGGSGRSRLQLRGEGILDGTDASTAGLTHLAWYGSIILSSPLLFHFAPLVLLGLPLLLHCITSST